MPSKLPAHESFSSLFEKLSIVILIKLLMLKSCSTYVQHINDALIEDIYSNIGNDTLSVVVRF